jgi:hypothetical protein
LSIANPNFSGITSYVVYLHGVGSLAFSFKAIHDLFQEILVICDPRNPKSSFQIEVLRSWGWDLTMLSGQRKSTIVASLLYGAVHTHDNGLTMDAPIKIFEQPMGICYQRMNKDYLCQETHCQPVNLTADLEDN